MIQPARGKAIAILVLFLFSVIIYFPGSYSIDSWNMYYQAASGNYNDWHSPVLSLVWKVFYKLSGKSYFILYIIQMLLYWLLVYWLLARVNKKSIIFWLGCFVAVLLVFIPQYVMKDTHNCIAWGLAAVLLIAARLNGKRNALLTIIVAVLLLYGAWVRMSAVFGLVPLAYAFAEFCFTAKQTAVKTWGIVAVTLVVTVGGNYLVNYKLLHAQRTYPQYKLKLLDIIGISKLTNENYLPAGVSNYPGFDKKEIYAEYSPATIDNIYWPANGSKPLVPYPDNKLNNDIDSCWKKALQNHPLTYLKNRGRGFLYYLRIKKRLESNDYLDAMIWIDPQNPFSLKRKPNLFINRFQYLYQKAKGTPFYDPWLWLLANIVLFIYCACNISGLKQFADVYKVNMLVQLSAIVYTLSQFLIYQIDNDLRYSYWNIFAFWIGLVVCFTCKTLKRAR